MAGMMPSTAPRLPTHAAIIDTAQAVITLDVVDNIRRAYSELEHSIIRALQTQVEDGARLTIERDSALRLLETALPVHVHLSGLISCKLTALLY